MRAVETPGLRASINVTPLVDVVLVLLIVFMVVAPRMSVGAPIELPRTSAAPGAASVPEQLVLALAHDGGHWIDGVPLSPAQVDARLREVAEADPSKRVVIHGDARLSFADVRRAMARIEKAGLHEVRLVAERQAPPPGA